MTDVDRLRLIPFMYSGSLSETTAGIEFNTAENFQNSHFDDGKWRHAPFRRDIPQPRKGGMKEISL
jgi:hypothetical protein